MTSLVTFEQTFRERLLDLVYRQWAALGVPFARGPEANNSEVIDPEALIWCSLEFLPTEPRLSEAVVNWTRANAHYLVRQRILKISNRLDPRTLIWQALDRRQRVVKGALPAQLELPYGAESQADVHSFVARLESARDSAEQKTLRLGRARKQASALLLRARDLLGHDIRHFLLVYLLASPGGARLRDIKTWSGYSYRSLADAADRWNAASILSLESGYCRLTSAEAFQRLLQLDSSPIVIVKWMVVFETSIRLLRNLRRARERGFDHGDGITDSLKREAAAELQRMINDVGKTSVQQLLECFS